MTTTRVALVPGVPALLPSYASIEDPVAALRAACLQGVGRLGPRVRIVAGDTRGLRVGRQLIAEAGAEEVDADPTGVLVVGNGSAKLTEKAPGHYDERAEAFDDGVRQALLEPLPAALGCIDEALAAELWADVAGLRALGDLLTPEHRSEVAYDDAPHGVQYWVVCWR